MIGGKFPICREEVFLIMILLYADLPPHINPTIQEVFMKLVLPQKFREIITTKISISGGLDTLIDTFSDWLTNNKTEFFPEYTDHGIDHIQSVINTAEEIISECSWEHITPEDIYVLTSSILLHDCAMHISKEGLWDLISNDLYNGVLLGFETEEEWSVRWQKFCSEVKRFDEHDYINFFGEYREVNLPEIGCNSLEDNQKIIIGDFVRRYHACIAQVIATYGIPSKNGAVKVFDSNFNYLNQLSGLIARSHNHSLREIVDLLGDERKREHRNTHPTYLMGVLRIADYLQLKSDRTPKILFNTIAFCSPISIKEWTKHLSIISTNNYHPDDELLYIEAYPEDANTLVGIKKLLTGLQKEFDEYWAVSGEVYSRYKPLNRLSLNYRRVKSNIDNPIKYVESNHKSYHPEVLAVRADNQKLFPLLIKPLYGDLPQVGLRELLQNSIDATNERYSQETSSNVNWESIPYNINIEINFDTNTFTLTDNGIGMNVEVIKDYFLKIGSSYRTSEQWKSNFCVNETTNIPRTGKFGIGMLAGFLIGDKIEVKTKHISEDSKSTHFNYKLDSNEIELKFIRKKEVGTTIVVHSNAERLKVLSENLEEIYNNSTRYRYWHDDDNELSSWWYFLDTPAINVCVIEGGREHKLTSPYLIKKEDLNNRWCSIEDTTLDSYYWRHNKQQPSVYCNGIMIQTMASPDIAIKNGFDKVLFSDLEICLFDNAGKFPLNLTRDELASSQFYEIEKLYLSVTVKYIKNFEKLISEYFYSKTSILNAIRKYRPGSSSFTFIPLLFQDEKIIPFGGKNEKEDEYVLVDFIFSSQKRGVIYSEEFEEIKSNFTYSCFENSEKRAETIEAAINFLLLKRDITQKWDFVGEDKVDTGIELSAWIYVKKYDFGKLQDNRVQFLESRDLTISPFGDWYIISKNEDSSDLPELGSKIISLPDSNYFMFCLYKVINLEKTEFSNLWEENILSNVD